MKRDKDYTDCTHLDNSSVLRPESEDIMSLNTKKIRRQIELNGVRLWLTADTEQEYAQKLIRAFGNASPTPSAKHNFRTYALNWFEVFSRPNITKVTAISYEQQLRCHILPSLGSLDIEDIVPSHIQRLFNQMGNQIKKETKYKTRIVLNQIFKLALDDGLIQRNPMDSPSIRITGRPPQETKPYSVDEMRYLAANITKVKRTYDRAWLALSISLPLRPEEVLGLKWKYVDLDSCTLLVAGTVTHPTRNHPEYNATTKTSASVRELAFSKEILAYLPAHSSPEEFVIGGKTPLSYTQLRSLCKRVKTDTGFSGNITPRRFRTTVATDISAATHDLKLVQRMLGHATPQMTLRHYDKGRATAIDATQAIDACYGLSEKIRTSERSTD